MCPPTQKGFTLVEVITTVAIFSLIVLVVGSFTYNVFWLNTHNTNNVNAVYEARSLLHTLANELRSASPSSLGAYPIEIAATSTLTFYADTNNDGLKERIRYFLADTTLKRGSITPSGSPLTYNPVNESFRTLVTGVRPATTTNLFQYYGSSYDGNDPPLSYGDVLSIRLVKITLRIQQSQAFNPSPVTAVTQVSLRNLKDNL